MITKLLVLLFVVVNSASEYKPIVLWHGMGDSCCFPFSLGKFKDELQKELPGVYVHSLRIGNSITEDVENGYLLSPNKQVDEACRLIKSDPSLKDGYNAIGFSQGGQFLRAVAQRCPFPQMSTLISFGGQHQGVFGLPQCQSVSHKTCEYFRKLLNHAAYIDWVQNFLVQATYWHNPLNEELYRRKSAFLADINNERIINTSYIANLQALQKFVLVKFSEDTMVQPRETEWFGFYTPGQDKEVEALKDTDLYKMDKLGLQQMMSDNKLVFLEAHGNHLQFTLEWFEEYILPFLKSA